MVNPDVPDEEDIDMKVWTDIAEHGLLIAPGMIFGAKRYGDPSSSSQKASVRHQFAYRIAFSMGTVRLFQFICGCIG